MDTYEFDGDGLRVEQIRACVEPGGMRSAHHNQPRRHVALVRRSAGRPSRADTHTFEDNPERALANLLPDTIVGADHVVGRGGVVGRHVRGRRRVGGGRGGGDGDGGRERRAGLESLRAERAASATTASLASLGTPRVACPFRPSPRPSLPSPASSPPVATRAHHMALSLSHGRRNKVALQGHTTAM